MAFALASRLFCDSSILRAMLMDLKATSWDVIKWDEPGKKLTANLILFLFGHIGMYGVHPSPGCHGRARQTGKVDGAEGAHWGAGTDIAHLTVSPLHFTGRLDTFTLLKNSLKHIYHHYPTGWLDVFSFKLYRVKEAWSWRNFHSLKLSTMLCSEIFVLMFIIDEH